MNKAFSWVMLIVISAAIVMLAGCGDVPSTPGGLTVTSNNPITLSWSSVANAKSYSVYRGTASGSLSTKTSIATGITTTSYIDTTATSGTTYYYQVTAVNDNGGSSASNEVQATAAGGSFALVGNVSGLGVALTWAAVTNATSYKIYRGTTAGSLAQVYTGVTATSYQDNAVQYGTAYYYQVAAVDAANTELSRSNITNAITP